MKKRMERQLATDLDSQLEKTNNFIYSNNNDNNNDNNNNKQ